MGEREGYMQEDEYIIAASSGETIGSGDVGGGARRGGYCRHGKGQCGRRSGTVVARGVPWSLRGSGIVRVRGVIGCNDVVVRGGRGVVVRAMIGCNHEMRSPLPSTGRAPMARPQVRRPLLGGAAAGAGAGAGAAGTPGARGCQRHHPTP